VRIRLRAAAFQGSTALAGKVSFVTTQIVCILALLGGQLSDDELIRLPVVNEGVSSPDNGVVEPSSPAASSGDWLSAFRSEAGGSEVSLDNPCLDRQAARPVNRLAMSWITAGGRHGFGNVDFDLSRTWAVSSQPEIAPPAITPGFGWHLWSGPTALDLPAQVYDLYLDLSWRFWEREGSGLAMGITPGVYGDFQRMDGDAFQLTGWILGNHRFSASWNLLGGLAYVRQLDSHLLPIGGLVWTPDENTHVEVLVPRPRFARRLLTDASREAWWYVAGQFGGGAWAVADTPTENVLVGYSDLRLLLGLQAFYVDGRELALEVGYVFNRDISVNEVSVLKPDGAFLIQAVAVF